MKSRSDWSLFDYLSAPRYYLQRLLEHSVYPNCGCREFFLFSLKAMLPQNASKNIFEPTLSTCPLSQTAIIKRPMSYIPGTMTHGICSMHLSPICHTVSHFSHCVKHVLVCHTVAHSHPVSHMSPSLTHVTQSHTCHPVSHMSPSLTHVTLLHTCHTVPLFLIPCHNV
jgi:hypothetical protein